MEATKLQISDLSGNPDNWDWENEHVMQSFSPPSGPAQSLSIQDIVESGTVLIAAGPADLTNAVKLSTSGPGAEGGAGQAGYKVVPIGLIESAQISLNKPLSRIFEIGSKLSYIIPGRTVGGISLSRVFFDGPSILKALYFGEVTADVASTDIKYAKFASSIKYTDGVSDYQKFANIGSGNMAMNLASSFFDQPMGLAFFFRDKQNESVSQTYFEGCNVSTYNLGISAGMNVLTEAVNIEFVRVRPINTVDSNAWDKGESVADMNIVSAYGTPLPT